MTGEAENLDEGQSAEDKFLGTRTTITSDDDGDLPQIEVIDDRPEEDRRPPPSKPIEDGADDDDLESYSKGVQKRIKKLSYEKNEFRRKAEEADRMREEAVRFAQQLAQRTKQFEETATSNELELVTSAKEAAQRSLEQSKVTYKAAYDAGDSDKMVEATEAMNRAQVELASAQNREKELASRQPQQQQPQFQQPQFQPPQQFQQPPQQQPQQPQVSEKAQAWAAENKWFGNDEHKDMTALAYGVHERLVSTEGFDPNSDEYYAAIDKEMRLRFPDYFGEDDQGNPDDGSGRQPASTPRKPATTVAPSERGNGGKAPRTVRLTSTQVALAKRLGLTPEQYANQLAKEMN